MKFPFYLSKKIVLQQPEQTISSEGYLLNHIEEKLDYLGMTMERSGQDELFLLRMNPLNTYQKKDFLRNLRVKVKTTDSTIEITLTSETILIAIAGAMPYLFLLIPNAPIPWPVPVLVSAFFWGAGYIGKWIVLDEVKSVLEHQLKRTLSN